MGDSLEGGVSEVFFFSLFPRVSNVGIKCHSNSALAWVKMQRQSCDTKLPLPHSQPGMSLPSGHSTCLHSPNTWGGSEITPPKPLASAWAFCVYSRTRLYVCGGLRLLASLGRYLCCLGSETGGKGVSRASWMAKPDHEGQIHGWQCEKQ